MSNELPAEIRSLIDPVLTGFNNKDAVLYSSAFGADAVIVDGIAPYRWTGANAQRRWFADAEKWGQELDVTNEIIVNSRIVHSQVDGTHANVVLSATLSFMHKGQPGSRDGVLIFTLAKQGNEWKIGTQAWGRFT
jgi:ketosteroid isomerase-like protein